MLGRGRRGQAAREHATDDRGLAARLLLDLPERPSRLARVRDQFDGAEFSYQYEALRPVAALSGSDENDDPFELHVVAAPGDGGGSRPGEPTFLVFELLPDNIGEPTVMVFGETTDLGEAALWLTEAAHNFGSPAVFDGDELRESARSLLSA